MPAREESKRIVLQHLAAILQNPPRGRDDSPKPRRLRLAVHRRLGAPAEPKPISSPQLLLELQYCRLPLQPCALSAI